MFFRAGNSIPALFRSYLEKGQFSSFFNKNGNPCPQKVKKVYKLFLCL